MMFRTLIPTFLFLFGCGSPQSSFASKFDRFVKQGGKDESIMQELLKAPDQDYLKEQLRLYSQPDRQEIALFLLSKSLSQNELIDEVSSTIQASVRDVALLGMGLCTEASDEKFDSLLKKVIRRHPDLGVVSGAVALAKKLPPAFRGDLGLAIEERLRTLSSANPARSRILQRSEQSQIRL